jgi:hypothetical protein
VVDEQRPLLLSPHPSWLCSREESVHRRNSGPVDDNTKQ